MTPVTDRGDRAGASGDRIVIVDDHGLLAQSLSYALRAEGYEVDHCIELTETAILQCITRAEPEVVLLDLDVGGELGTTQPLIPEIAATDTSVVMLTGVTDRVRLAECIEAGAVGVIPKSRPFDDLIASVQQAARTGSLLPPSQRDAYLTDLRRHRETEKARLEEFATLTPKESQVLLALMDGLSADQIASDWVVSIATVRSQIRTMMRKLGVNSQLSAVALARKSDWPPSRGESL